MPNEQQQKTILVQYAGGAGSHVQNDGGYWCAPGLKEDEKTKNVRDLPVPLALELLGGGLFGAPDAGQVAAAKKDAADALRAEVDAQLAAAESNAAPANEQQQASAEPDGEE